MAVAVAFALAAPGAAWADDAATPMFSFSGFGTLGVVKTNTDLAEYGTSVLQPGGATTKADFGVDSLLAGQVNFRPTKSLSFVGQIVANRTADDDFVPHVEWAFAQYAIIPDLSVRAGILAVPIYLQSDSRLVGFANPWVRPPTAVYSQSPFTNYTGIDLVYRHSFGGVNVTVQPYFGEAKPEVPDVNTGGHTKSELEDIRGVNVAAEIGSWTVRAGYLQTQFTYRTASIAQLIGGVRQVAPVVPGAAALANSLDPIDKQITFAAVGVAYDSGNILFQGEYAKRKADFFLADTTSYYATLGYRFGPVMPHITLSRVRTDSPTSQSVIPAAGPLAAIGAGVNTLLATQNPAQKTIALGVRWQFARNADVKLQWDRVNLPPGGLGNFQRQQPGFAGSNVNVYSAAVDFVF
jgi:hypothetical protein